MRTAEQIRAAAEAAQQEYTNAEARLYRSDGQKLYSDSEHAEQIRSLQRERNRKLTDLAEESNNGRLEAEGKVSNVKNRDLGSLLSPEELASANNRYTFISEEVMEMNSSSLTARMDSVLAAGDRASAFCHARAIRKRASQSERPAPGLQSEAKRAEDHLFGENRDSEIESAETEAKEYLGAQMLAGNLRRGATTPAAAWAAGRAGVR